MTQCRMVTGACNGYRGLGSGSAARCPVWSFHDLVDKISFYFFFFLVV